MVKYLEETASGRAMGPLPGGNGVWDSQRPSSWRKQHLEKPGPKYLEKSASWIATRVMPGGIGVWVSQGGIEPG